MEQLGTDFNATGSVMSRTELEDQRRKRGECVTCGRKCFQKKLFKMIPITDHGRVLNGRCLNCNPLDASDGAIPAVSRPATQADLARFTRSQNNLRSQSGGIGASGAAAMLPASSEPEQRRSGSHAERRSSSRKATRRPLSTNSGLAHSSRSLSRGSLSSGSPSTASRSSGGSYELALLDSGSQNGATTRSVHSSHSATAGPRGLDSGMNMPPGGRPGMSRPNSNRSISASSYYSSRSRTSQDSGSVMSREWGEPRGGRGRSTSPHDEEDESEGYDDYNGHLQADDAHDAQRQYYAQANDDATYSTNGSGIAAELPLDYYQRSYHERQSSNRSLHSTGSHESLESAYNREGDLDNGSAVLFDNCNGEPVQTASGITHQYARRLSGNDGPQRQPSSESVGSYGYSGTPAHQPGSESVGSYEYSGMPARRPSSESLGSYEYSKTSARCRQVDSCHEPILGSCREALSVSSHDPTTHDHTNSGGGFVRRRASLGGAESARSLDSAVSASFDDRVSRPERYKQTSSPDLQSFGENDVVTVSLQTSGSIVPAEYASTRSEGEGSQDTDDLDPAFQRMRDAGNDFVEIVNCMRDYQNSADVQAFALQSISNMELTDQDSSTLANIGAVQVVIDAMDAFHDDLEMQIYGCRAIRNASGTPENQRIFVEFGALDVILRAMSSFVMNGELQEQALAVLANLSALEDNLERMDESGAVERLVDAMNKHAGNAQVQVQGCLAMANLASHPTAHKRMLIKAGGGSAIVISMVMHPNDHVLQEKALRSLRNLSANCDENRVELTNIGGIDAIISAMQVHRDSAGVQEAGAWTLSNLADNADSNALIGDCGGIDVIVRAMWVHSDKLSVQEWCCRALYALSSDLHNRKMVLDVGGISAIVNAMQAHVDAVAVQEMGCAVLCNLATDQQSKMRIVDEEALDAVVLAMVLYSDDGKVQERSCQLLLQLSIAENFKAMQASNVGELVRSAAQKFPDGCAEPAERLIHVIEGYISQYL